MSTSSMGALAMELPDDLARRFDTAHRVLAEVRATPPYLMTRALDETRLNALAELSTVCSDLSDRATGALAIMLDAAAEHFGATYTELLEVYEEDAELDEE
ncbi:hypothetical protein [Kutzneria buriramensis]|uniref:Excreted virulence factor EspC (Type VII ESX diderm) n=1 Tax=Kutzneria buriramensis TaxID=1045776 RepID=A0A3E0GVW0_9PSEU|nr:hypothetical protein [Kutzneria buriramensis]REH31019.1 hypothetical protein BCF44_12242 [Kutzneria buriramensis]